MWSQCDALRILRVRGFGINPIGVGFVLRSRGVSMLALWFTRLILKPPEK